MTTVLCKSHLRAGGKYTINATIALRGKYHGRWFLTIQSGLLFGELPDCFCRDLLLCVTDTPPLIMSDRMPISIHYWRPPLTPNCYSRQLYTLCTSTDLNDIHQGIEQLGLYLWPVARNTLSSIYDDTFVQDCIQEALVGVWHCLERGDGPNSPDSFLALAVRITKNKCIDRVRYEDRRPTDGEVGAETVSAQTVTDVADLPEDYLFQYESTSEMFIYIAEHPQLAEKAKQILIGGFLFDKTDAELAQEMGEKRANIRLIRHRAFLKLRDDDVLLTEWIRR